MCYNFDLIVKSASSRLACLLAVVLLGGTAAARAQNYSLTWYKIAGGGGTSTGTNYSLSGTIGQPDAGVMIGNNYSISGGFWGIYSVVQTPGAPTLTITPSGANVVISWPAPSTGFFLQQNPVVNNAGSWSSVGQTTNVINGTNSVTIPATGGTLFFRLKNP
jgi:hypothetical protein